MLNLKALTIERVLWGEGKGQFAGEATFDGDTGKVTLKLTPYLVQQLLLLCADAIIGTAKEAATTLVIEAQATVAHAAKPTAIA